MRSPWAQYWLTSNHRKMFASTSTLRVIPSACSSIEAHVEVAAPAQRQDPWTRPGSNRLPPPCHGGPGRYSKFFDIYQRC
jgi:hypothetical protein